MGRLPGGTMRRILVLLIPLCLAAPAAPLQTAGEVQTTLPRLDAFEAPAAAREPIAIGGGRQLFIDRLLIARSEDLLLTVTAPERHPANPVLRPETPSDGQYLSVDSVWWNPERRIYQLWYSALHFENGEQHLPAYAESKDGLHWERPSLGVRDFGGSRANNLVEGPAGAGGLDPRDGKPGGRDKRVTPPEGPDAANRFLPRGRPWKPSGRNPALA